MRTARTLGLGLVAAALSGTVLLGAQAVFAEGHHAQVVRVADSASGATAADATPSATSSPANDPWD
jgi:hypothetical protein